MNVIFYIVIIGFFFAPTLVGAADQDIIINEIAAYESSDYEWIEIYNKGTTAIDITGWKFFEANTNHSISTYRGDFIIESGEYAVIANKADKVSQKYPQFTGTLLDSSWSSLSKSGEQIALKNKDGTIIEQFTYIPTSDYSLERKDSTLSEYTSVNWKEHASSNTFGAKNSGVGTQQAQAQQNINDQPESAVWYPRRGDVLINELVSDPTDNEQEWIELVNKTQRTVDLSGWKIINGSGVIVSLSGMLENSGDKHYHSVSLTSGFLLNTGDAILLQSSEQATIDQVTYGTRDDGDLSDNAPTAVDPYSLARIGSTFNNRDDFRITSTPTKGAANMIKDRAETSGATPSRAVIITELFPNPADAGHNSEFIELYNPNDNAVSIEGWELTLLNGFKYIFQKGEILGPKTFRAYGRDVTNLALKNTSGERVRLYAPHAALYTDEAYYTENAPLNMSYARDAGGTFRWTKTITRAEKNVIVQDNHPPVIIIEGPFFGRVADPLTFDASDTSDADGDYLRFEWNFGDGATASGPNVSHAFTDEDAYSILLTVSDGKTSVVRMHHISIEERDKKDMKFFSVTQKNQVNATIQKIEKKNIASKIGTVKKSAVPHTQHVVPLNRIRSLKTGTLVQTEGIVSAAPGFLNANNFYIAGSSGIQVWNPNKEFPKLQRGDRVRVSGTLRKNSKELALRIVRQDDIAVMEHQEDPEPKTIPLGDVSERVEGLLVRISGTIADMRWPNIYLEDGDARMRVYIPKNTDIKKATIRKGATLSVVGIVSETSAGYRIIPRDQNDIIIDTESVRTGKFDTITAKGPQTITLTPRSDPRTMLIRYFIIALMIAMTVIGGIGMQYYLDRKKGG